MPVNEEDAVAVAVPPEAWAAGVVVAELELEAELLQPTASPASAVSTATYASLLPLMRPTIDSTRSVKSELSRVLCYPAVIVSAKERPGAR
jgi:hypothetical protein